MSSSTLDKLVYSANQIATAFRSQQPDRPAEATAEHIRKFWDPRMRSIIADHFRAGGEGLGDIARTAVEQLVTSEGR